MTLSSKLSIPIERKNEIELILHTLRYRLNNSAADKINQLVNKDIDWEFVTQTASTHKILPLLYKSLSDICKDKIPSNTFESLKNYYLFNTKKNLISANCLIKLLDLLKQNGIQVIPFKGPVLAETVYGNLSFRTFDDLDILINEKDAEKTFQLMISNGYRPLTTFDSRHIQKYITMKSSIELYDDTREIAIDLHWELTGGHSSAPYRFENIAARLGTINILDKQLDRLSIEDMLLAICLHGLKDDWNKLERIYCLALLLNEHPGINWSSVLEMAERLHCIKAMLLGLLLAREIFLIDLPENIITKINNDSIVINLALDICNKIFKNNTLSSLPKMGWRFSSVHLKVRDTLLDRIRYVIGLITRPTVQEWQFLSLPKNLTFLYYILRPIRLMGAFIKWLIQRVQFYFK